MADEKTAVPSTADLDEASSAAMAEGDFARYQEIENARESGKPLPEASAPSTDENTETSDKTPASETGSAKEIQEKKAPKTGEDRKAELAAEIQDLLKKRAELQGKLPATDEKPGDKKADPPPAAKVDAAAKPEAPKKPSLNDFKTYAEYEDAHDKYIADRVKFEANQVIEEREAKAAAEQAEKTHREAWDKQVSAAKEDHADFAEVAFSKDTPITPVMDGFILDSENGARVLYELGKNGSAEGKRIAALSPYAAVRALVAIEAALPTAGKKAATTPVKKYTAAPAPATDLGAKNTAPVDDEAAALASGDVGAYMAAANARERKAQTGR